MFSSLGCLSATCPRVSKGIAPKGLDQSKGLNHALFIIIGDLKGVRDFQIGVSTDLTPPRFTKDECIICKQ